MDIPGRCSRSCFPCPRQLPILPLRHRPCRVHARLNIDLQLALAEKLETEEELKTYLLSKARAVNAALDLALSSHPPSPEAGLVKRGKRIRPVLCLAACEVVGGSLDVALPAACAVELIHKMSTRHENDVGYDYDGDRVAVDVGIGPICHKDGAVHVDDVVDDAKYDHGHASNDNGNVGSAPTLGPSLMALAFEHISSATKGVPPDRLMRVVLELGKAAGVDGIVAGLFVDKTIQGDSFVDVELLDYVHLHKTAALLEGSVASGAILGGGSDAAVERLRRYARFLSLLFAVVVDILDSQQPHHNNNDTLGRKGSGRVTYPEVLGMEQSKQLAQQLHCEANHQLKMFDSCKAAPLYKLTDYLLELIQ